MEVFLNLKSLRAENEISNLKISDINPAAADSDLTVFAGAVAGLSNNTLTGIEKVIVTEIPLAPKNVSVESSENALFMAGTNENDTLINYGDFVTIDAQGGSDFISNTGVFSSINAGADSDSVISSGAGATIVSGDGDNYIENYGSDTSVVLGAGDDTVISIAPNVTIDAGAGNNFIDSEGDGVSIF